MSVFETLLAPIDVSVCATFSAFNKPTEGGLSRLHFVVVVFKCDEMLHTETLCEALLSNLQLMLLDVVIDIFSYRVFMSELI